MMSEDDCGREMTMPATIPAVLLLARERADSFRRCVEILHDAWKEGSCLGRNQAGFLLADTIRNQWDARTTSPLVTLEWALEWANSSPPPPAAALREARAALEATASSWAESSALLSEMQKQNARHLPDRPGLLLWPEWIQHIADLGRVVASEKRRIDLTLRECWPVGSEAEERAALAEMRQGAGVELEDAFAEIANVSKEEWLRRVEQHKQAKIGQAGQDQG